MAYPKAYDPQEGYKYQMLCRMAGEREWEHMDYAEDYKEYKYLLDNYRAAYGSSWEFKRILLPQKYHPKKY